MTSQEQSIKIQEATAQKWAARKARWAAWKAEQAKKQRDTQVSRLKEQK